MPSVVERHNAGLPHRIRLAARGETPPSHRDGRGATRARRGEREYREYLNEPQRSPWGCIGRRMQAVFRHGLLAESVIEGHHHGKAADESESRNIGRTASNSLRNELFNDDVEHRASCKRHPIRKRRAGGQDEPGSK